MQAPNQVTTKMGYRQKAADSAVESRQNDGDSSGQSLDGIDVDWAEVATVGTNPTTLVEGTFPEDEGDPVIRFRSPEYNDGRQDQGYLGLVLDDPEVIADPDEGTEDTVILKTDDNDSADVRIFNESDHQTKVAGDMGVKYGDRLYEGDIIDEIPTDRIVLRVTGTCSKNVARRLDKKGAVEADMDDNGDKNGGLIEYKPYDMREPDDDYTSRYARDPELKSDLYGARIAVLLGRREELDDENTGYGTEHTDPDRASYAELVADDGRPERPMKWYVVFNAETGEQLQIEDTGEEIAGYSFIEWRWDPEAGRMPDDQWEWVESYVEKAEDGEVDTDEDTIVGYIEADIDEGNFESEPTDDEMTEMVSAIQNQV